MKRIVYSIALILILAACQKEKELVIADHGPSQTITCDQSALMGSMVRFSVDLQDNIDLSTLKVSLLFDETVVADTTIRTKTVGTYEGMLKVPFEKNIPDGEATLRFVSQNIQFGTTTDEKTVAVSRPDFEYLTLYSGGNEYRMSRTGRNEYATEGMFSGSTDATIVTAPFDADGRKIHFGFSSNTGISPLANGLIPFSDTTPNYSITFNTLSWKGAPFVTIEFNGVSANMADATSYVAVLNITKGQETTLTGAPFSLEDVMLDPDFFTDDGKFAAMDGLYKVTILLDQKYFLVERMVSATEYAGINSGAVWMIGEAGHYGKPGPVSAGWNPEKGGICMAEVEPGIFQLTQEAGSQMALNALNVKLFHQKSWGGEFGGDSYAAVNSDLIYAGESDGNIHLIEGKSLEMGGIYRFTLDITGGVSAAILSFEKVGQKEIEVEAISINGVEASMAGVNVYTATVFLTKGTDVTITGVDNVNAYWWDPDFFDEGRLNVVDGRYTVTIDQAHQVILARRVNDDDTAPNLEQGGLYVQGWGIAAYMMDGGQVGWPGTGGFQLAQVADKVYQMTGKAVNENDPQIGGRFRTDYWNVKFFFQDGWGGESSKELTILGNAAGNLSQGGDGNIGLSSNLEEGATYRITVDFSGVTISGNSIEGKETVSFDKL
ncbi:MAG: DUF5121 domain-containing protein [Bacteroidales bacterium]|nr:DUF5121 domain-containing protein [Bacteroidales bacterium]